MKFTWRQKRGMKVEHCFSGQPDHSQKAEDYNEWTLMVVRFWFSLITFVWLVHQTVNQTMMLFLILAEGEGCLFEGDVYSRIYALEKEQKFPLKFTAWGTRANSSIRGAPFPELREGSARHAKGDLDGTILPTIIECDTLPLWLQHKSRRVNQPTTSLRQTHTTRKMS